MVLGTCIIAGTFVAFLLLLDSANQITNEIALGYWSVSVEDAGGTRVHLYSSRTGRYLMTTTAEEHARMQAIQRPTIWKIVDDVEW